MEKKITEKQKAALKKGREALKKKQASAKKAVRKELSKTKKSIKKSTSKIMTAAKKRASKAATKQVNSLQKRLHKKGLAGTLSAAEIKSKSKMLSKAIINFDYDTANDILDEVRLYVPKNKKLFIGTDFWPSILPTFWNELRNGHSLTIKALDDKSPSPDDCLVCKKVGKNVFFTYSVDPEKVLKYALSDK